jgi:hypothetical protein
MITAFYNRFAGFLAEFAFSIVFIHAGFPVQRIVAGRKKDRECRGKNQGAAENRNFNLPFHHLSISSMLMGLCPVWIEFIYTFRKNVKTGFPW